VLDRSVSLSGDTVLAGAPKDTEEGDDAGAAYVFTKGTTWGQVCWSSGIAVRKEAT